MRMNKDSKDKKKVNSRNTEEWKLVISMDWSRKKRKEWLQVLTANY